MTHLRLIEGGSVDSAQGTPSFSHAAGQIVVPAGGGKGAVCMDQLLRKQWSEDRLRSEHVPIDPDWPLVAGEKGLRLRTRGEVADRALALAIVVAKAAGIPQLEIERIVDERGAYGLF